MRNDTVFTRQLDRIARESGTPGVSAAYFSLGRSDYGVAVAGVRRAGDPTPVVASDRFNVGSNTKPIISTIVATLVRDGLLRWDMTLAEALPELAADMHPDFRTRTLRQALTMRAGIDALYTLDTLDDFEVTGNTAQEQRRSAAGLLLSNAPSTDIGVEAYSNGSYVVITAIIERITGRSWEENQRTRVFEPLGISGTTGWPGDGGVDAPWGHQVIDGVTTAIDPATSPRFQSFIQPAGDLSITATDLAVFARAQLAGLNGIDTGLGLDQSAYETMHASDGFLAMPWGQLREGNGRVSLMIGSSDLFFAGISINRDTGIGAVYLANGELGEESTTALFAALDAGLVRAAAVPEPSAWILLIAGFGLCGAMLRRQRSLAIRAA